MGVGQRLQNNRGDRRAKIKKVHSVRISFVCRIELEGKGRWKAERRNSEGLQIECLLWGGVEETRVGVSSLGLLPQFSKEIMRAAAAQKWTRKAKV